MLRVNRSELAARLDRDLRERVLPYWHRTAIDSVSGGYRIDDTHRTMRDILRGLRSRLGRASHPSPATGGPGTREWHIVSQSRLLYVFSLAHRLGYGDGGLQYLEAAEHGHRFLESRLRDHRHGGYFWRVGDHGQARSSDKWLYGQSFALFALIEFYRASRRPEVLAEATALFQLVQERMLDPGDGGWFELLAEDFSPLQPGRPTAETGIHHISGLKSANGHLHWMEALSELVDVTGAPDARAALAEVLRINTEVFFASPGLSPSHVTADWRPVVDAPFDHFGYGHEVEFAWLMLRAQQVLETAPNTALFGSLLSHSLDGGFDWVRGGFYLKGRRSAAMAFDTSKVWWVQAEGLAALAHALVTPGSGDQVRYEEALALLVDWIWRHQRLRDGIWVWSTDTAGRIQNPTKADNWKAGYHEVRAMAEVAGVFRAGAGPRP